MATNDTNTSGSESADNQDGIERRLDSLESQLEDQQEVIESQQERIEEQAAIIETQRQRLDDGGDDPVVDRRTALQAGGVLGLLGIGAGTASAAGDSPSGQIGTDSNPLNELYTATLYGSDGSVQLGANLDINGNEVQTTTGGLRINTKDNGNLILDPGTSNKITVTNGPLARPTTSVSSATTITAKDYFVEGDTSSSGFTITLPSSPSSGEEHIIKKKNGSNSLTIDGNGNNIDGSSSVSLSNDNDAKKVVYDGSEWQTQSEFSAGGSSKLVTGGNTAFQVVDGATDVSDAGSSIDAPNIVGGHPDNTTNSSSPKGVTISGGGSDGTFHNIASANYATVGGGQKCQATDKMATVSGGNTNEATKRAATVSGGELNSAKADAATVVGGDGNDAEGQYSTVCGGKENQATTESAVAAGHKNSAIGGKGAAALGGISNRANSKAAVAVGGDNNTADANYSLVAGRSAESNGNAGSFVWGDSSSTTVTAGAADEVRFQATGGFVVENGNLDTQGGTIENSATESSLTIQNDTNDNTANSHKDLTLKTVDTGNNNYPGDIVLDADPNNNDSRKISLNTGGTERAAVDSNGLAVKSGNVDAQGGTVENTTGGLTVQSSGSNDITLSPGGDVLTGGNLDFFQAHNIYGQGTETITIGNGTVGLPNINTTSSDDSLLAIDGSGNVKEASSTSLGDVGSVGNNITVDSIDDAGSGDITIKSALTRQQSTLSTNNATISSSDYFVTGSTAAAGSDLTIKLPSSPVNGEEHFIKQKGSLYTLTIDGNGNDIDGQSSVDLTNDQASITIIYNGTNWKVENERGAGKLSQKKVTADGGTYNTNGEEVITVDTTSNSHTINLSDAVPPAGRHVKIVDTVDASANNISITADASITGPSSTTISTQYGYREYVSDGNNWREVGSN